MEGLSVTERLNEVYEVRYKPGLYSAESFLETNNSLPQLHFYLTDTVRCTALGHIAFSIEESEAISPFKAPFAGFELAPGLASHIILYFLRETLRRLQEKGFRFLRVKIAPACYQPDADLIIESMKHLGFEVKECQIYHAIGVNGELLNHQIASMEQRRLRKAFKESLTFRFVDRAEFPSLFDFIKRHREAKGHRLSMDWTELKSAIKANGKNYLVAGVYKENQLIAASILVRVSNNVIYNFCPAHDANFNTLSPMVFLIHSVYNWCQQEGIDWIDLGTSQLGNRENKSLVSFKKHMGGQPFESITFRKTLSS